MRLGDRLIREIAARFSAVEEQFEILRWIDKSFTDADFRVDTFLVDLLERTQKCFGSSGAEALILVDGSALPFILGKTGSRFAKGEDAGLQELLTRGTSDVSIEHDQDDSSAVLVVPFEPDTFLKVVLLFRAPWYGGETSVLHDPDLKAFASMLAEQCRILLGSKLEAEFQKAKTGFLDSFLSDRLLISPASVDIDPEMYWRDLANRFIHFLPVWGPLAFETLPRIQVLTYDGNRASVLLRAARAEKYSTAKALLLHKTISGIVIQDEEQSKIRETRHYVGRCLYVDPTQPEFSERYKSYLFEEVPRSELVIPIRHGGKIVGLINIEHMQPNVFTRYHVAVAERGAEYIAPFAAALLHDEEQRRSRDRKMLYVLQKIMNRMAKTFSHKVGQSISLGTLNLEKLEKSTDQFTGDQKEALNILKRALASFESLSQGFLENMPNYLSDERVSLIPLVIQATREFDAMKGPDLGDVEIIVERDVEQVQVYGSALLREHLYNVLNNSVEAVRSRIKRGEISKGLIRVFVTVTKQTDQKSNIDSHELAVVRIEDNGGGMTPSDFAHILEENFTTKADEGGTGFGLTAADAYLRRYGGFLRLSNEHPDGFVAELRLPIFTVGIHDQLKRGITD